MLPIQGALVQSLVRELDPTLHAKCLHAAIRPIADIFFFFFKETHIPMIDSKCYEWGSTWECSLFMSQAGVVCSKANQVGKLPWEWGEYIISASENSSSVPLGCKQA